MEATGEDWKAVLFLLESQRFDCDQYHAAQVKALVNMVMNINTAGLAEGRLNLDKVRSVVGVATPENEAQWAKVEKELSRLPLLRPIFLRSNPATRMASPYRSGKCWKCTAPMRLARVATRAWIRWG